MKKALLFLTVASLFAFVGCEKHEDDITPVVVPLFSVSEGHQVLFSSGNLVYDSIDGYRFAANQYDHGGYFGWGTGSNPTLVSKNDEDYATFDDWGSHIDGGWRTLTLDEWNYVTTGRADAAAKCGVATVCDVHGIVLLPDNWSGGAFNAGFDENRFDNSWDKNVYDASAWSDMEKAGAVFLPALGFHIRSAGKLLLVHGIGSWGNYWSSTSDGSTNRAYVMFFNNLKMDAIHNNYRHYGLSVRLVRDI